MSYLSLTNDMRYYMIKNINNVFRKELCMNGKQEKTYHDEFLDKVQDFFSGGNLDKLNGVELKYLRNMLDSLDKNISVKDLDNLIFEYLDAEKNYEEAKKISNEKYRVLCELEERLIETMTAANKRKYFLKDVGTVSVVTKYTVQTPKTIEEKEKFTNYLREKYGQEVFLDYFSVNHNKLNAFYNQEVEQALREGNGNFQLPGIEAPTHRQYLSIRKN